MKKIIRVACGIIFGGSILVLAIMLRHPPDPLWLCQKGMEVGIDQYLLEAKTNIYPNIEGDSIRSFRLMAEYMIDSNEVGRILADYAYVPGLKADDPKDLVVFYLKRQTRKTWNGDQAASVFSVKRWMVIGPEFSWNGPNGERLPEGGQVLSTGEFKNRLKNTLSFLQNNERPHWQTVVKEQSTFLESLKER